MSWIIFAQSWLVLPNYIFNYKLFDVWMIKSLYRMLIVEETAENVFDIPKIVNTKSLLGLVHWLIAFNRIKTLWWFIPRFVK